MKLGLALPHYDFSFPDGQPVTVGRVVDYARRAEEAGFDSVWVSDHLFLDVAKYGAPSGHARTPEAFAMLSAIAAGTRRVRLGSLVLCAPFRIPTVLALQAASVAQASGGRLELGVGAGWFEPEFDAAGISFGSFGERAARLSASLDALRDHVPTFVGGKGGPRLARLIAEHAGGWNVCWWVSPDDYRARLETLHAACAAAGRDPSTVRRSVGLSTLVGRDERHLADRFEALQAWTPGRFLDRTDVEQYARKDGLIGTLESCAARIKEFEALGVEEIIVSLGALPFSVFDDEQIDLVGRDLRALVG